MMRSDLGEAAGKESGTGCMILFALPFAAAGVFAAVQAVRELGQGNGRQAAFLGIFGLAFGGVGCGLLYGTIYGARRIAEARAREESAPDEPWRWRADWAAGRIVSASRPALGVAWGAAVLWNLVASPVLFALPEELRNGNRAALIALLFPLIGTGLFISAVRKTLRWRRFGP